jgi:hypothetical protein
VQINGAATLQEYARRVVKIHADMAKLFAERQTKLIIASVEARQKENKGEH